MKLVTAVAALLMSACGGPSRCGELLYDDESDTCVCPEGTEPRPDLGVCILPDGGTIPWDAGLQVDASADAGVDTAAPDSTVDDASADTNDAAADAALGCPGCQIVGGGGGPPRFSGIDSQGHTCVLVDGNVWCFGGNHLGQVGDGSTDERRAPIAIGLTSIVELSASEHYTCALQEGGRVYCWGGNLQGRTGQPIETESVLTPTEVVGVAGGSHIATGWLGACAVNADGVLCWGEGSNEPVLVEETSDLEIVDLSAGREFFCVLLRDQTVQCWGSNARGQLGQEMSVAGSETPVTIASATQAIELTSAGSHSCIRRTDNSVHCWGSDSRGQIGDGSAGDGTTHRIGDATGIEGAVAIAAGGLHALALDASGRLWGWGEAYRGQLGHPPTTLELVSEPLVVGLPDRPVVIGAGVQHSCWFYQSGELRCMGANENGQLGDGTATDRWMPVAVALP